jgi:hypothetical protein
MNKKKKKYAKLLALFINSLEFRGRAFIGYFTNRTLMTWNGTSMFGMWQKTVLDGFN